MYSPNGENLAKPFLRWAGGKKWLINATNINLTPNEYRAYHEPFLGGGSVFFSLSKEANIYLSDYNHELTDTYCAVRDNVEMVISEIKKFNNTKEDYYSIRQMRCNDPIKKAAQFIYLNKTSFNGIYRVNRKGEYNVPYGYRTKVDYIDENNLRRASLKLSNAVITAADFESSLSIVKNGDFVFIDPPYTVAHGTNGFIEYNQKIFTLEDQYRLAAEVRRLNQIGAFFIVTNAFHDAIYDIYKDVGEFKIMERSSSVGGRNAKREIIKEYVIKNF